MELTKENYFSKEAQLAYIGSSQIKAFIKCPACALAELRGEYKRPESIALLQGQYLDSLFEGAEARTLFEQQHPEMISTRGTTKGQPKTEYQQCIEAYKRVMSDPVMAHYANGVQQVVMVGEIQGVPAKIMIDSLHDDIIVDRKFMRNTSDMWLDGERLSFAEAWGYDIQAYLYQTVVEQNLGIKLPFALAVVTKEAVPDIDMFLISQETIDNAGGMVRANIERIQKMKNGEEEASRCEVCDYCKATKKVTDDRELWRIL